MTNKEVNELKHQIQQNEMDKEQFKDIMEQKEQEINKLKEEKGSSPILLDFQPPKAGQDDNSKDITLNLNISQYPSNSHNQCAGMLAASDLYDLPRQVNFSNSQIEA